MTLNACPLCGGRAEERANFYATRVHIECRGCGLFTLEQPVVKRAELRALWNHRTPIPNPAEGRPITEPPTFDLLDPPAYDYHPHDANPEGPQG